MNKKNQLNKIMSFPDRYELNEKKDKKEWQQGIIYSKTPQEHQFFHRKQVSQSPRQEMPIKDNNEEDEIIEIRQVEIQPRSQPNLFLNYTKNRQQQINQNNQNGIFVSYLSKESNSPNRSPQKQQSFIKELSSILENVDKVDYNQTTSPRIGIHKVSNQSPLAQSPIFQSPITQSPIVQSPIIQQTNSIPITNEIKEENKTPFSPSSKSFFKRDHNKKEKKLEKKKLQKEKDEQLSLNINLNGNLNSSGNTKSPKKQNVVLSDKAKQQIILMSQCKKAKRSSTQIGLNLDRKRRYMTWKASEDINKVNLPKLTYNEFLQTKRKQKPQSIEHDEFFNDFEQLEPMKDQNIQVTVIAKQIAVYEMKK